MTEPAPGPEPTPSAEPPSTEPPSAERSPDPGAKPAPEKRRWRWRRLLVEGAIVLAVYFAITAWRERDTLPDDQVAPAFAAPGLDGRIVRLEDFAGKTVLLHFWATWCGVCKAEIPMLRAIHENLGEDEVLLAVVASEQPDEVAGFVAERGIDYPVIFADRALLGAYGVTAFPTYYVIGPEGRVEGRTVGLTSRLGIWARMRWAER